MTNFEQGEKEDHASFYNFSTLFATMDEYLINCRKSGQKKEITRVDEVLYRLLSDLSTVH
jgi:hypothetical protein